MMVEPRSLARQTVGPGPGTPPDGSVRIESCSPPFPSCCQTALASQGLVASIPHPAHVVHAGPVSPPFAGTEADRAPLDHALSAPQGPAPFPRRGVWAERSYRGRRGARVGGPACSDAESGVSPAVVTPLAHGAVGSSPTSQCVFCAVSSTPSCCLLRRGTPGKGNRLT